MSKNWSGYYLRVDRGEELKDPTMRYGTEKQIKRTIEEVKKLYPEAVIVRNEFGNPDITSVRFYIKKD